MNDHEKKLRKEAIEATIDGWSDFIRDNMPSGQKRDERLLFAYNNALVMVAHMPLENLAGIHGTHAEMRRTAYDAAKQPSTRAWLLGNTEAVAGN